MPRAAVLAAGAFAALFAAGAHGPASAVDTYDACPRHGVLLDAAALCEAAADAQSAPVVIDIGSGTIVPISAQAAAHVPFRGVPRADSANLRAPHFLSAMHEAIRRLAAERGTPIVLTGPAADVRQAASELHAAGYWNVVPDASARDAATLAFAPRTAPVIP